MWRQWNHIYLHIEGRKQLYFRWLHWQYRYLTDFSSWCRPLRVQIFQLQFFVILISSYVPEHPFTEREVILYTYTSLNSFSVNAPYVIEFSDLCVPYLSLLFAPRGPMQ